jgi:stress response protein SCP2
MLQKGDKQLMAAMQKVFKCLSCSSDIRLERKPDNSGWIKTNLDGTPHVHDNKKGAGAGTSETQQQLTAMSEQIKILIAQVQLLRSEIKELKK